MKCRKAGPNLEEHVVGRHGELAGVQHQALREQGEEAVAHHDLRFSPDQDVMEIRGQPVNITIYIRGKNIFLTTLMSE